MKSRPGLLKEINERKILNSIYHHKTISRAELARKLKLTLPTVSRIVDDLLQRQWLVSVGMGDSSGGRPPSLVQINPAGAVVIGVDLGRESVRVVCTDLLANILCKKECSIAEVKGPEDLAKFLQDFIQENDISKESLLGIGIASPGPLDPVKGKLFSPEDVLSQWLSAPIVETIQSKLGLPAWLANDADVAALAENWFGSGQQIKSTLLSFMMLGLDQESSWMDQYGEVPGIWLVKSVIWLWI